MPKKKPAPKPWPKLSETLPGDSRLQCNKCLATGELTLLDRVRRRGSPAAGVRDPLPGMRRRDHRAASQAVCRTAPRRVHAGRDAGLRRLRLPRSAAVHVADGEVQQRTWSGIQSPAFARPFLQPRPRRSQRLAFLHAQGRGPAAGTRWAKVQRKAGANMTFELVLQWIVRAMACFSLGLLLGSWLKQRLDEVSKRGDK